MTSGKIVSYSKARLDIFSRQIGQRVLPEVSGNIPFADAVFVFNNVRTHSLMRDEQKRLERNVSLEGTHELMNVDLLAEEMTTIGHHWFRIVILTDTANELSLKFMQ